MGLATSDVLLNALPIFHVHGLFIASHCALLNATPMIFLEKFEVSQVMAWLPEATVMMGVPTFYTRLLDRQDLNPGLCCPYAGVYLRICAVNRANLW